MKIKEFIKNKKIILKLILIILFIAIDLISKAYFESYFTTEGNKSYEIFCGFITLTFYPNDGAAFGILSGNTVFLSIVSIVFVIAFIFLDFKQESQNGLYVTAFSLIMAGAIGNFIDRIFLNYVRDFIKFSIFDFVCNIADICICLGIALYILELIISMFKSKKQKSESNE